MNRQQKQTNKQTNSSHWNYFARNLFIITGKCRILKCKMHHIIWRMQFVQKNNKSNIDQTGTKYGIHDQSLILRFIQEKNKPKLLDGTTKTILLLQAKISMNSS